MPAPNGPQFKETYLVRGKPVNLLSEQGMSDLVGTRAHVHMHSPATEKLGRPIFSVLVKGTVTGHTDNIVLSDSRMRVDKRELEKYLNHPNYPDGGKTRNTFVNGVISNPSSKPISRSLRIRPGSMTDAETGEDVSSDLGRVHLGPHGAKYRPNA